MDIITTAIVSALTAGVKKAGETSLVDAYNALKNMIKKKFGEKNAVSEAVDGLETRPESEGRRITLQEEISQVGADNDQEIVSGAEKLLDLIKSMPKGDDIIGSVTVGDRGAFVKGNANVTATGDGNVIMNRSDGK